MDRAIKTAAVITLGCKINTYESMALKERLGAAGIDIVPEKEPADLFIINSCSVTKRTDAETRKRIRRAKKANPDGTVVVTGCYAQIKAAELHEMPEVDYVIDNTKKGKLVEYILGETGGRSSDTLTSNIREEKKFLDLSVKDFKGRNRAFLKIQDGCDSFCSYCIVPYARGGVRSLAISEAIAAINRFVSAGFKEVVLSGIHIGKYGVDLAPGTGLLSLLKEIERSCDIKRLRLSSIEPNEIGEEFIEHLSTSSIICNHLHIPLQSGDDTILQRMNRTYATAGFAALIDRLKQSVPDITIGADVIVGFPSESDESFSRTYDFIQESAVDYLHVFPYSKRDGTTAHDMPGQIAEPVKKARAKRLRELGAQKRLEAYEKSVGKNVRALFEKAPKKGSRTLHGITRNYLNVIARDFDDTMYNEEFEFRVKAVAQSKESLAIIF